MNYLSGLANVNVELTSRCNKSCWMCGRRKIERDYPELVQNYGDMEFSIVEKVSSELPYGVVVQLHNNGESLLYHRFGDAVRLFRNQVTNVVTNGKLLLEKSDEIIDNIDTITISIIENDSEADVQYSIIGEFLRIKGDRRPAVVLRLNGNVDISRYAELNTIIATRTIHHPMGSFGYRSEPVVPEIGICLDFLHHLSINKDGMVSICVRFDPIGLGIIGDINTQSLNSMWNSPVRLEWLELHKMCRRDLIPLCSYCQFWGVPIGNIQQ